MKNDVNGPMRRRPSKQDGPDGESLAIEALTFIGSDPEHAARFFSMSGLDPSGLRTAAAHPDFLAGVLDYLVADESLLLAFAAGMHLDPETIVTAHRKLRDPARHGFDP